MLLRTFYLWCGLALARFLCRFCGFFIVLLVFGVYDLGILVFVVLVFAWFGVLGALVVLLVFE